MEGRLIVRIVCGKEVGTAFYVAPDLLLTAYHTVACYSDDAENIVKDSTDVTCILKLYGILKNLIFQY